MRHALAAFVAGVVVGMVVLPMLALTGVRLPASHAKASAARLAARGVPTPAPVVGEPLAAPAIESADLDRLRGKRLLFPVEGMSGSELLDNYGEQRGDHPHEALDILAPRGTRVLAVDDGIVKRLFTSVRGGLTVYQFDPSETYCYYYAHLDRYAEGLLEEARLRKGDLVGYVGTTGNAPAGTPHLHFTIFKLGPERRWWEGTPLNPYPLYKLP